MPELLKKEKILIIESDVAYGERVAEAIRKKGYTVSLFKDGIEGEKAIYDLMPHLILVDILLEHTDGYEILQRKASEPLMARP